MITLMREKNTRLEGLRPHFCSILVFHVRDMLSSRLISDIYTLFYMVLDCLRVVVGVFEVVVEFFEVVVDGFRWF